jgi:hypothetical protein
VLVLVVLVLVLVVLVLVALPREVAQRTSCTGSTFSTRTFSTFRHPGTFSTARSAISVRASPAPSSPPR